MTPEEIKRLAKAESDLDNLFDWSLSTIGNSITQGFFATRVSFMADYIHLITSRRSDSLYPRCVILRRASRLRPVTDDIKSKLYYRSTVYRDIIIDLLGPIDRNKYDTGSIYGGDSVLDEDNLFLLAAIMDKSISLIDSVKHLEVDMDVLNEIDHRLARDIKYLKKSNYDNTNRKRHSSVMW